MTQQSPSVDLLPCPFCGGTGILCMIGLSSYYIIKCEKCGARTNKSEYDKQFQAVQDWNTRANPTPAASEEIINDWEVVLSQLSFHRVNFNAGIIERLNTFIRAQSEEKK